MIRTILPGARSGIVKIPASKSQAHRALIAAALSRFPMRVMCRGISDDIQATMNCLKGLGADFEIQEDKILVTPVRATQSKDIASLPCSESGSTLRFLLPLAGAFGADAQFLMEGRLPERPMKEYEQVLGNHGMTIRREGKCLYCSGRLQAGDYVLPGNISSQYFTGLLLALPLLPGESLLQWEGTLESADYVAMTEEVLEGFGIRWEKLAQGYRIPGDQTYHCRKPVFTVEGDYSSAAFFLCMGAFSREGITAENLSPASRQGDSRVLALLRQFGANVCEEGSQVTVRGGKLQGISIDASMIPDLVPAISVVAAGAQGTTHIFNATRLRLKESDRIRSTCQMLRCLGADVRETTDGLIITGTGTLKGGAEVDPFRDHRIAMAAAEAACICRSPVTVRDAQCVSKSYPGFWQDLQALSAQAAI